MTGVDRFRVLFVDDEASMLSGTRRATHKMRDVWEMHFAEGGAAALAALEQTSFDVVISDMRMPGLEGAELLERVRAISPGTARIILSGYSEEASTLRSARVAHQFLSKPCDIDQLKQTISEIAACRSRVETEAVRSFVGGIDQLPSLGQVYNDLTAAISSDSYTPDSLGAIVAQDVGLSAELLRLVNSSFFGVSRHVESVGRAIGFLGVDVVKAIVAAHSLFDASPCPIDIDALNQHSRLVGALSSRWLRHHEAGATVGADAFLAGLLHDVGVLVLAGIETNDPAEIAGLLDENDIVHERLEFGVDRFAVGAYLLKLWAFPSNIVDAIESLGLPAEEASSRLSIGLRVAHETVVSGRVSRSDLETENESAWLRVVEILDATCESLGLTNMEEAVS